MIIRIDCNAGFFFFSMWIGLYTNGSGKYYWQDKPREVAYQQNAFWNTSEPNGGANSQQCVAMTDNGKWVDDHCSSTKPYICQYKIIQIQRGN